MLFQKETRLLFLIGAVFFYLSISAVAETEEYKKYDKYRPSDYHCSKLQPLIEDVTKAVTTLSSKQEWEDAINIKSYLEKDIPENEKVAEVYMNLVLGILDWGESVDDFRGATDFGSLERNKEVYSEVNRFLQKEQVVLYFCPSLKFPDFSYWNEVIKAGRKNAAETKQRQAN